MAPREILQQHFSAYSKLTLLCKCGLDDVKQLACGSFYVELDMTYAFMPASASAPRYGDAFAFKYTSCGVCNKEDVNHVACLEFLAVFLLLDADGARLNYATAFEIACGLQEVKEVANRMTGAERKTLELAGGSKMSEELVEKVTTCRLMRDRVSANWPLLNFEPGHSEEEVIAVLYEWSQSKEFKDNTIMTGLLNLTVATGFDAVPLLEDAFAVWKNEWRVSMADRAHHLEWLVSRGSVVERFPEWDQKETALYDMLLADALKKQTRIFQLIEQREEEFGEESTDENIDPQEKRICFESANQL